MYSNKITPLPVLFMGKGEVKSKTFTQVKVSSKGYIYRVEGEVEGDIYFEVFERRVNSRFKKISYPRSKSFGVWAWIYSSLNKALKKLNQIEAK